jgi:hypothetical protein
MIAKSFMGDIYVMQRANGAKSAPGTRMVGPPAQTIQKLVRKET